MYYNQGKNVREIGQEARMSFRDISTILKKASNGSGNGMTYHQQQSNGITNPTMKKLPRLTNSSQAKKSLKVAIELGTREKQVNNLFRKFWKLSVSTGYIKSIQG